MLEGQIQLPFKKQDVTLQGMLSTIRKLTRRVWVAVTTFAIGVALTLLCVVHRSEIAKPPAEVAISNRPQQLEMVLPDGWRQLDFNNKVLMMLPPDMRPVDSVVDFIRYSKAYSNGRIHLTIMGDVQLPELEHKLPNNTFFTCDAPVTGPHEPTRTESHLRVDERQAKLAVVYTVDHGITSSLCFPNADDTSFDLLVVANGKDEQDLTTARQIFSSIRFKK